MQVERSSDLNLFELQQQARFVLWTRTNDINRILFDLDDTICATGQIFDQHKQQALNYLTSSYPHLSPPELENDFRQADHQTFEKYAVNPNRFNFMSDSLGDKYHFNPQTRQALKGIFEQIYLTPVTFLDGAELTLKFLKKTGIPIGIVTHGNPDWTFQKFQWLNLDRFLNFNDVFVVDQNSHKTSQSWQQALNHFHLLPYQCAVIGDSPRSDINPAFSLGVKHCFLVINQNPWSVHQQPIDPSVQTIKNISNLIRICNHQP